MYIARMSLRHGPCAPHARPSNYHSGASKEGSRLPFLHLTIPANSPLGKTVDGTFGKDAVRVTLIADDWLRIEPDTVCRILTATSRDGRTTMCVHQPAAAASPRSGHDEKKQRGR